MCARDPSPLSLKRANRSYAFDPDVLGRVLPVCPVPSLFIQKSRAYVFYNTTQANTACFETGFQSAYFNQTLFVKKKNIY